MAQARRDGNYVTSLLAVSNVDGETPVILWADPVTHRLLVTANSGGIGAQLPVTGIPDGNRTTFTTTQEPTWLLLDGAWKQKTNADGSTNWSWSDPTITISGAGPLNDIKAFA